MTRRNIPRNELLKGMRLCLSGFEDNDKKSKICALIKEMGGTYTPDLMTTCTTHLIMADDHGPTTAKYEEAVKTERIEIVHYKWLEMCSVKGSLLSTRDYNVILHPKNPANSWTLESVKEDHNHHRLSDDHATPVKNPNMKENWIGHQLNSSCHRPSVTDETKYIPCPLFSSCTFFFVGFDEGIVALKNNFSLEQASKSSNASKSGTDTLSDDNTLYHLQSLVRLYMGTISWTLNENNITHVIVNRECCSNTELRTAISTYCMYNPNSPVAVTPNWIVSCVEQKCLLNTQLFSMEKALSKKKTPSPKKKNMANPKKVKTSSNIFSGDAFHIVCLASHPDNVQFDSVQVQEMILSHGGCLLSTDLINLRRKEIKGLKNPETRHRICYIVIVSGGFQYDHLMKCNSLLSQIKTQSLFRIIPVTPIWIQACISEKCLVNTEVFPILFQPQAWAVRVIPTSIQVKKSKDGKRVGVSVSVSGFLNHERSGIQHILLSIGAKYTESLPVHSTHLICHPNAYNGAKAVRAIEWGIHVVTVDWLFHIMQFGFHGENNEEDGCEHRFRLKNPTKALETDVDRNLVASKSPEEDAFLESEGSDLRTSGDVLDNGSSKRSNVFEDIACPMEQIDSGGARTRKRRTRTVYLETQRTKDINSHEAVAIDVNQNYQSDGTKRIWQKQNMADGDDSQMIWWGSSNFG